MATDFSSLDKLVEFGLGIGIATQMMNTMNHVIAKTAMPGVSINPGISPMPPASKPIASVQKDFYIVKDDRVAGPLSEAELDVLVKNGSVSTRTFCWYPGLKSWRLAEDIPEVNKLLLLNA